MTDITSMSGRLHSEFVSLLFLKTHRETDRFFATSGVQLAQSNSGLLGVVGLVCPCPGVTGWMCHCFGGCTCPRSLRPIILSTINNRQSVINSWLIRSWCRTVYVLEYQFRLEKRKIRQFCFDISRFRFPGYFIVDRVYYTNLLQTCEDSVLLGSSHVVR
jgi:hypothetical protein